MPKHSITAIAIAAAICLSAVTPAHAVFTNNGISVNGINPNGINANGIMPNAISQNSFDAAATAGGALGELNGVAIEAVFLPALPAQ